MLKILPKNSCKRSQCFADMDRTTDKTKTFCGPKE